MSTKTTTIMSRRDKITKAGSTVFIAVAIASVIVAFSAVSLRFLLERKAYNDRVIAAKTSARDSIKSNLSNLSSLSKQFTVLDKSDSAVNSKVILHALPPTYDYAALATSMQFLANRSGVTFTGGVGTDSSASAITSAETSTPQQIPLSLTVEGDYDAIVTYMQNLENSIRPIQVTAVTYTGTNEDLKATITAVTYYQPARSLEVTKSEVK